MLAKKLSMVLALTLTLVACSRFGEQPKTDPPPGLGSSTYPSPFNGPNDTLYIDDTLFTYDGLWAVAYGDTCYPDEFFEDVGGPGWVYYEKEAVVTSPNHSEPILMELCTDNKEQARLWSDRPSPRTVGYPDVVDESETEKYFEFKRKRVGYMQYMLSRVHKCSYIELSPFDWFQEWYDWYLIDVTLDPIPMGTFHQRPIIYETVKELCEYLFVHAARLELKVIRSSTLDQGFRFEHTIYSLSVVEGDWGMRDEIILMKRQYTVDQTTGTITYKKLPLWVVPGRAVPNPYPG